VIVCERESFLHGVHNVLCVHVYTCTYTHTRVYTHMHSAQRPDICMRTNVVLHGGERLKEITNVCRCTQTNMVLQSREETNVREIKMYSNKQMYTPTYKCNKHAFLKCVQTNTCTHQFTNATNMVCCRAEKKGTSKKSQEETFQELIQRAKKTKSDAQRKMNQTKEVCLCICMYACICGCVGGYSHTKQACMCGCLCGYRHTQEVCVCIYTYASACICIYTYACMCGMVGGYRLMECAKNLEFVPCTKERITRG
jgi:hypothetical protein